MVVAVSQAPLQDRNDVLHTDWSVARHTAGGSWQNWIAHLLRQALRRAALVSRSKHWLIHELRIEAQSERASRGPETRALTTIRVQAASRGRARMAGLKHGQRFQRKSLAATASANSLPPRCGALKIFGQSIGTS